MVTARLGVTCTLMAVEPALRARGLPRDLCAVLETALERDLTRRYATALDLAEDLRRVRVHGGCTTDATPGVCCRRRPPARRAA